MAYTYNHLNNDFDGENWLNPKQRQGTGAPVSGPITVTQDGVVSNSTSTALSLRGGAYTVIVNGQVTTLVDATGLYLDAFYATGFLPALSTINVGATGTVSAAGDFGIGIWSYKSLSVTNAGSIGGPYTGIRFDGDSTETLTVVNTGRIWSYSAGLSDAIVAIGSGARTITNSGTIIGSLKLAGGTQIISNTLAGIIDGKIETDAGLDTITNAGSIYGVINTFGGNDVLTNSGYIERYIDLGSGNNKLTNSGFITGEGAVADTITFGIGNDTLANSKNIGGDVQMGIGNNVVSNTLTGLIYGDLVMGAGDDKITNAGLIAGQVNLGGGTNIVVNTGDMGGGLVGGLGTDTVTNSKNIEFDVALSDGLNTFSNSGLTGNYIGGTGVDKVTNSGTLVGTVTLGNGINSLLNSGTIETGVIGGTGVDTITNSKIIRNQITLFQGNNVVTNTGEIQGTIIVGLNDDKVSNSKFINGSVILGDGANSLTNTGVINGLVDGGSGVDTITNSGTIETNLKTYGGNDVVKNSGKILNEVDLGLGDDSYTGGIYADKVRDAGGKDTYLLGAENDFFLATLLGGGAINDGLLGDKVDGGLNLAPTTSQMFYGDVYSAGDATSTVRINADSVAHTNAEDSYISAVSGLAKGTAIGSEIGLDLISNFESFIGGDGGDLIWGNAVANVILGGSGNNHLHGGAGNDLLYGGVDNDQLSGDAGADILSGGLGLDTFIFHKLSDSTAALTGQDLITDFTNGSDKISLVKIDTLNNFHLNTGDFTDAAFDGTAGAVRVLTIGDGWLVQLDSNGDKLVDLAINVRDYAHLTVWDSTDFIL